MLSKIIVENYYTGYEESPLLENYFDLLIGSKFRLEKIVSKGYKTPEGKWLNEDNDEFVLMLKGKAELLFENKQKIVLVEGDYFIIPANTNHKVLKTSVKPLCFWLTIHFKK
jgi:cupin 2 domain-containing protein